MIVVADTGPLNYLVQLGFIHLLPIFYGRVIVPPAVLQELRHDGAPPEVRSWAGTPPSWLETITPERLDATLPEQLGPGEREAISLALFLDADLLLMDEHSGRQRAIERQLAIAGTLRVLLDAALLDLCDFPEAIGRLRALGFRISATLEALMLAQYAQERAELDA